MPTSVTMPALGESVTEGTVTRWLKQEGDQVEVDEPLLEVSTDKVDTEIPSPIAGVIEAILVQEDETVEVGTALVTIGDGSGAGAEAPAAPAEEAAPAEAAPAEAAPAEAAPAASEAAAPSAAAPAPEVSPLRGTTQPMSRLRKVVAERAVVSMQSTAQLTSVVEVDVTKVAAFRDRVKGDFVAKTGVKLSF